MRFTALTIHLVFCWILVSFQQTKCCAAAATAAAAVATTAADDPNGVASRQQQQPMRLRRNVAEYAPHTRGQQRRSLSDRDDGTKIKLEVNDEVWELFLQNYDMSMVTKAPTVIVEPSTTAPMVAPSPTVVPRPSVPIAPVPTTRAPIIRPPTRRPILPPPIIPPTKQPVPPPVRRPTQRPVRPPTRAPMVVVTPQPVPPPRATTVAPVPLAPLPVATKAPVTAPIRPPTRAPRVPPTKAPISVATKAPAVDPVPAPVTKAPVPVVPPPPTKAPVTPPTQAPLAPPTKAPVPPPTKAPIAPPTKAPIAPPTKAPIAAPTKAPVPPPTNAPVASPTRAPVAPPTKAPVVATKAPVVATKAPIPTALPVTKAPVSKAPTTKAPTTNAPITNAPITKAPVTKAPVTKAPVVATTAPITTRAPASSPIPPLPVARPTTAPVTAAANLTLLGLVQSTPELSTLLSAIQAADANRNIPPFLAPLLSSAASSLTVFAPTNSAFNALDAQVPGYVAQLLTPEFGLHLFNLIGYHVTQGEVLTTRFPVSNLQMLASGAINVTGSAAGDDFQVQSFARSPANLLPPPNILATNGVAHLVDNVLVPRFVGQNLVTALQALNAEQGGRFSTLLRLVEAAGLETTLANAEGVTLLAPTNEAITPETADFLLQPENADILQSVLSYHVINERFNFAAQSVPNILLVDTLQNENIVVGLVILDDDSIATTYNQATQEEFFLTRENIGYVIDTLLIPPSLDSVVPNAVSADVTFDPALVTPSESSAADDDPDAKR